MLGALGTARKLEVNTALTDLNKSLLNFYIVMDRYPTSEAEFKSHPQVAAAAATVAGLAKRMRYRSDGKTYRIEVTLRDGSPLVLTGSTPGPRGGTQ